MSVRKGRSSIDFLAALPRGAVDRLQQARRDVTMVVRSFQGRPASPLVARPTPAPSAPRAVRPRTMNIVDVVHETSDAVSIYLEAVDGQSLAHSAGQFLTVNVDIDGVSLRRAYSLASPATPDARPHITVKRVRDGRVSNFLNDTVAKGQTLRVLGPSGNFVVETDPKTTRRLVLIAGGSGITPIMSIMDTVLQVEPKSYITLIYGNRSEADIIFRDRVATLQRLHGGRLQVDLVLEEAAASWQGSRGRLDAATARKRLEAIAEFDATDEFYVCGPAPMRDAVRAVLVERGVDATRIHEERFTRPREQTNEQVGPQALVLRDHGRVTKTTAREGQTLLEAGLAAGVDMPFSCAMGGCAACKVRLIDGDVAQDEPTCLTQAERDEGWVLTCSSHALTPCIVELP